MSIIDIKDIFTIFAKTISFIMNVYLGEYFEKYIKTHLNSGRYKNASEVIREGLRKLEESDEILKVKGGINYRVSKWKGNLFVKKASKQQNKIDGKKR